MKDTCMADRTPQRQRELDARARELGFRNYDEMSVYYQARERKTGGTIAGSRQAEPPPTQGNADNAMSWHPAVILDRVRRKWRDAMGDD